MKKFEKNISKHLSSLAYIVFFFFPFVASAADDASELFELIFELLQSVASLLVLVALVAFLYGVMKFILTAGNAESRQRGRQIMIYGVIALFVMVSVWGLVAILQETFLDSDQVEVIEIE